MDDAQAGTLLNAFLALDAAPDQDLFEVLAEQIATLPGIDVGVVATALPQASQGKILAVAPSSPSEDLTFAVIDGKPDLQWRLRAQCLLSVPLLSPSSDLLGWLCAGSRTESEMPAVTLTFLRAFAGRAASEIFRREEFETIVQQRDLYRDFFHGKFFATMITRLDGEVVDCNQACADLLGYDSPEELRNSKITQAYWEASDRRATLDRLRRDGTISRYRTRFRSPSGRLVDTIAYAQGRFDENGASLGTAGILFEYSDRQRFQDHLLERSALLETTTEAVIVCQPDRTVKSWNAKAQEVFQFPADIAMGLDWSHLIGPSEHVDLEEAWEEVMTTGLWNGEMRLEADGGTSRVVRNRWHLLTDSNGTPRSVLMVGSDVTEARTLESASYRVQRLESLGTLAGGIAHDLNNVLTPMLISANLLKASIQAPDDRRLLDSMVATAQRGKEMVQQILWFARGTGGERRPIRLYTVLQELQKILEATLPRSIDLELDISKNLPAILGDVTQIFQALMNLSLNARDAMPSGGHLKISARLLPAEETVPVAGERPESGGQVVIEIADTGCGIQEEEIEKIFDPFFTTKAQGDGTGLGLTTVESIVKSHGGGIQLFSEVGRGTLFRILLPAFEAMDEEIPEETDPEASPLEKLCTVLVAEDDPTVLEATASILESRGYRVLRARDGSEAVEVFAEHSDDISVVLCDQDMPILDGLQTLRVISRISPEVKMLLVTGLPGFKPALDTVNVLQKPWNPQELMDVLGSLLDEPPSDEASAPSTSASASPSALATRTPDD